MNLLFKYLMSVLPTIFLIATVCNCYGFSRMDQLNYVNKISKNIVKRNIITYRCVSGCKCPPQELDGKTVDCSRTRMTDIPGNIPGGTVKFNVSRNLISRIKEGILDNLRDIEILDLSHNNIKEIPKSVFKDLYGVKVFDISFNSLKNISLNSFGPMALNLEVLNVSSTELSIIPELHDKAAIYMTKLTHLSMANNSFTSLLPGRIPPSVKFLDLSCLNVRILKNNAFSGLVSLEEVVLKGCDSPTREKLKSVEHRVFFTTLFLRRLDLSGNDLPYIPNGLPSSLEYLDLSENRIRSLKQSQCATESDLTNQLHLPVEQRVGIIGSVLSHLTNLQELRLNGNTITNLCIDDFVNLEKIKVLNISGCMLSSFHPHTFVFLRSLQVLDLSYNQLRHFKSEDLSTLEELFLQGNILEDVGSINRKKVPALKKANFADNNWRCDCKLKPFVQLIGYSTDIYFENLHGYSVHYVCSFPLKLKGKPLLTLNMNDLVCENESSINVIALAAPTIICGILLLVVGVIALRKIKPRIQRRWAQRRAIESGQEQPEDISSLHSVPSNGSILRNGNMLNDAAILCNPKDQDWVVNKMLPNVREYADDRLENGMSNKELRLNMNVFTVGKTIKIERLSKCIDFNRKIVIVVTHDFIEEESSVLLLNVVRERSISNTEDDVIILIMDAIPWSSMPQSLQFLMVEKTFVQYPQEPSKEQNFWEVLCPHLLRSRKQSQRFRIAESDTNAKDNTEINNEIETQKRDIHNGSNGLDNPLNHHSLDILSMNRKPPQTSRRVTSLLPATDTESVYSNDQLPL